MKHNYIAAILVPVLLILIIGIYGYFEGAGEKEIYNISVIVEKNDDENWETLKQGIESAAKEYKAEVNFISLADYTGIEGYVEAVSGEIQNGADGLILDVENNERLAVRLDEVVSQENLVLLEREIPLSTGYTIVAPDHYQMGYDLGEKMREDTAKGEQIGIIGGNRENLSIYERVRGVQEALLDYSVEWIYFDSTAPGFDQQIRNSPIVKYMAPDSALTEKTLDVFGDGQNGKRLYGIGASEKIVYYLDKGIVRYLAVPDEYIMGYMGMRAMYNRLNYIPEEERIKVDYILVNKENLHAPENESLMFPIVQ